MAAAKRAPKPELQFKTKKNRSLRKGEISGSGRTLRRVRGIAPCAGKTGLPASGRARHGSDDEVGETERGPDNQGGGGNGSEEGQKGLTGFLADEVVMARLFGLVEGNRCLP